VWVLYYDQQRQGKELVASESDPLHHAATPFTLPQPQGPPVEVNLARLDVDGRRRMAVFWYEVNGRVVASRYLTMWLTLWSTVSRGTNAGAVVLVMTDDVAGALDPTRAAHMQDLGSRVHGALRELLPGERP
jgi:hypothetical protein